MYVVFIITLDSQLQLSNELFEYVKRACMIDDDETQPHVCNQKIAFTTGEFYQKIKPFVNMITLLFLINFTLCCLFPLFKNDFFLHVVF